MAESIRAGGSEADEIRRKALEYAASRRAPVFGNDPNGHSLTPEEQRLVDKAVNKGATASDLDRLVQTRRNTSLPSDQRTELDRFSGGANVAPPSTKPQPSTTPAVKAAAKTPPSAGQVRQAQQTANFNKQVQNTVNNVGNALGAKTAAQSIDDKIAAYKGGSNQSNAPSDPFDPVKLTNAFRKVVGIDAQPQGFRVSSGRQFNGSVSEVDVVRAAQGGHSPSAQENYYDVKEAFNHPTNQRMLAQEEANRQAARVDEARTTGQVSYGTPEQAVGALKTAGAPYVEGYVHNQPAGTEGKDFNTNTAQWVDKNTPSLINGRPASEVLARSNVDRTVTTTPSGGTIVGPTPLETMRAAATMQGTSAPTTDQMRASLASAREVQNQVANRESQNTNPTQVQQPNQPPPPLQNKRPEDNY